MVYASFNIMCTGRIKHDCNACNIVRMPSPSKQISQHIGEVVVTPNATKEVCLWSWSMRTRKRTRYPKTSGACVSIVWNFLVCARFEQRDMPLLTCHTKNVASTHQTAHITLVASVVYALLICTSTPRHKHTRAQHQHKAEAEHYIKTSNLLCAI